jgi:hypothetical protein
MAASHRWRGWLFLRVLLPALMLLLLQRPAEMQGQVDGARETGEWGSGVAATAAVTEHFCRFAHVFVRKHANSRRVALDGAALAKCKFLLLGELVARCCLQLQQSEWPADMAAWDVRVARTLVSQRGATES